MNNQYYLTVYSQVDPYLHYHKTSFRHDHNMSLWKRVQNNVELLHHWEFERITGYKHHNISFSSVNHLSSFINEQLSKYDITLSDIEIVIGTPGLTEMSIQDNNLNQYTYHSLCHLFSCIMLDSHTFYTGNILGLSYDGGSDSVIDSNAHEKHQYVGCYSKEGKITYFPISSPACYWYNMKNAFSMEEGSIMALATASKSTCIIPFYNDDEMVFVYNKKDRQQLNEFTEKIFDAVMALTEADAGVRFNYFDVKFTMFENKVSMVAKIIHDICIKQVDQTISGLISKFEIDPKKTCMAISGGYALNCPTNTHIMNKFKFSKQLIPPCANDGGQAIGMGLHFFYNKITSLQFKLSGAYYGDSDNCIDGFYHCINSEWMQYISEIHANMNYFVSDLCEAPIIWFNDRAEIGPRALGNRSILADPRSMESKEKLNQYKQRQWWRPVAPIVIDMYLHDWFENAFESPYMLNTFKVIKNKRKYVPAILHKDNTARIQTLSKAENRPLYNAILSFYQNTSIPIICNTSLNDHGEPIINSLSQTINFALRKRIDIIYFNSIRIKLKNHDQYLQTTPMKRNDSLFTQSADYEEWFDQISPNKYKYYKLNQDLGDYDLRNPEHIKKLTRMYAIAAKYNTYLLDDESD